MKFHEIKSYLQDIEHLVLNLKTELDQTRSLLYRTWLKNQNNCKIADDKVLIPDDIDFITTVVKSRSTLLSVQDVTGSNYERIGNQLYELGFQSSQFEWDEPMQIKTSREVFEHLKPYLAEHPYELFYIILLNSSNRIIKTVRVSEGGISGTVVDSKKIFKIALNHYTTGIILSHNHPSGNLQPSSSDQILTKKIVEAGKLLDITVLDHLIIGGDGYYSFSDDGMMG